MIVYLITTFALNILNNFFHKAIIKRKSSLWHSLSALIDVLNYSFVILASHFDLITLWHWYDFGFYLLIPLFFRLITRDFMLGIGTTSWMDKNIRGFWRLVMYLMMLYFITIFILNYYL